MNVNNIFELFIIVLIILTNFGGLIFTNKCVFSCKRLGHVAMLNKAENANSIKIKANRDECTKHLDHRAANKQQAAMQHQ